MLKDDGGNRFIRRILQAQENFLRHCDSLDMKCPPWAYMVSEHFVSRWWHCFRKL